MSSLVTVIDFEKRRIVDVKSSLISSGVPSANPILRTYFAADAATMKQRRETTKRIFMIGFGGQEKTGDSIGSVWQYLYPGLRTPYTIFGKRD